MKKLRKAKMEATPGEKPDAVRTHLRNMIVVPEMIGSVVAVYNGKSFNQVRNVKHICFCARMEFYRAAGGIKTHFLRCVYVCRSKSSRKWLGTIWANSPSHTDRFPTVDPVSDRPTRRGSSLSSR